MSVELVCPVSSSILSHFLSILIILTSIGSCEENSSPFSPSLLILQNDVTCLHSFMFSQYCLPFSIGKLCSVSHTWSALCTCMYAPQRKLEYFRIPHHPLSLSNYRIEKQKKIFKKTCTAKSPITKNCNSSLAALRRQLTCLQESIM